LPPQILKPDHWMEPRSTTLRAEATYTKVRPQTISQKFRVSIHSKQLDGIKDFWEMEDRKKLALRITRLFSILLNDKNKKGSLSIPITS